MQAGGGVSSADMGGRAQTSPSPVLPPPRPEVTPCRIEKLRALTESFAAGTFFADFVYLAMI